MNARDLIQQWEREADGGANRTYYKCARDLRAALPEQPLAEKWRGEAGVCRNRPGNEPLHLAEAADIYEQCAADLDSHESESRELLREALQAIVTIGGVSPRRSGKTHLAQLSDRIRKHLGGESDEA